MPILTVSALMQDPSVRVDLVLKRGCAAVAAAYGCAPDEVRGIWHILDPGHYVDGREAATRQPPESHPPIARLSCMSGRTPGEIERIVAAVAFELGDAMGLSGNVCVIYEQIPPGRMFDRDSVVTG